MRQWSGGPLHETEVALTGTSRRQKSLPRIIHNDQDENIYEPLTEDSAPERYGSYRSHHSHTLHNFSQESPLSKCVYTYEDKYMFNRIISGTDLLFDSHFESGNLCRAFRRETNLSNYAEYDLTLSHDVHSIGHTQWFYFSVSNITAGMTVKFNIGTFSKTTSLFNHGMRPLLYSEKKGKWCRCGENISYSRLRRKKVKKKHIYTLTFTHRFEHPNDKCFFAYSYPYTYSNLQDHLRSLQLNKSKSYVFRRSILSRTLAGNRCDLLTITEKASSLAELKQRKGIVVSARVHPGETVASWICKGVIDFLTGSCANAEALRKAFVFKVIPMLNPDGVVNGNYRTSLSGVDLNRRWHQPHKLNHPTIYCTKLMMKRFQKTRNVITSCDIHGHSRREGLFMYGCPTLHSVMMQSGVNFTSRTIPELFDEQCDFFCKQRCTFKVQGCKASTMRVVMNQELGIQSSYTLEASLSGYKGFHFSLCDLQKMGRDYCLSLLQLHRSLTMQVKCNLDAQLFSSADLPHEIENDKKRNKSKLRSRCNTSSSLDEKTTSNLSVEEDSGGSDSNPSEDNISESEALKLLSRTHHLPRRKKKKKSRGTKKKSRKPTTVSKSSTKREMRSCTVVHIGSSPLSEDKTHSRNISHRDLRKEVSIEKRSLSFVTFPLDS